VINKLLNAHSAKNAFSKANADLKRDADELWAFINETSGLT
jgi:hypothetical protein